MSDRSAAASDGELAHDSAAGANPVSGEAKVLTGEKAGKDEPARATAVEHADATAKPLSSRIDELKALQAAMLADRKRVSKDLRNFEKRRKRLKASARRLSNDDLTEVMLMREATRMAAETGSDFAASASSASPQKKKKKGADGEA